MRTLRRVLCYIWGVDGAYALAGTASSQLGDVSKRVAVAEAEGFKLRVEPAIGLFQLAYLSRVR